MKTTNHIGRPSLGDEAKIYPLRMRLPLGVGKELEKQADTMKVSPSELARQDILRAIKRRKSR